MLCVPPERITSALPRRINSNASPIACELAAQAVRQLALGPLAPKTLARCPEGVPGSCSASRIACSSLIPNRVNSAVSTRPSCGGVVDEIDEPGEILLPLARSEVDSEPIPVQFRLRLFQAESFIAIVAAARANLLLRECSAHRAASSR